MTSEERQNFGEFIRLDKNDPELAAKSGVKVFAVSAEAGSPLSLQLLLDPRSALVEGKVIKPNEAVGWRITANRVNAQVPLPRRPPRPPKPKGPGPHHLVGIWTVVDESKEAHGVLYRVPPAKG